LRLAHFFPATHPAETVLVKGWSDAITAATNGKVKISSYPGESLLKAADIYNGVVEGVNDIGLSCFAYTPGRFPVLESFELPGVVSLGGLFASWFTPTEAGAIGTASILFITLLRKQLNWAGFRHSLMATIKTTAVIGLIFVLLIYLVLGCVIDALAMILLTIPIFYPVVVGVLGYDPIWFGVIIVLVVALGVITPPVGMNVFIIKGVVKDLPVETIFKGVWPFILALFVCIMLLILFPGIVTFLPSIVS